MRYLQERCNGGSLRHAIDSGAFASGTRPCWQCALALLSDIATGMAYMHARRICHGELEPSNILLHYDKQAHSSLLDALCKCAVSAKVNNFGAAVCIQRGVHDAMRERYVAPEVAAGKRLHQSSDMYALGVIMWELSRACLLCAPPFKKMVRLNACRLQRSASHSCQRHWRPQPCSRQSDSQPIIVCSGGAHGHRQQVVGDGFPEVPKRAPLAYALMTKACLSGTPADRPSFQQAQTLLHDVRAEVAKGTYVDTCGKQRVCSAWAHLTLA